jgi:RNA polymerase sigma factor (sigma-70 family)
MAQAQLGSVLRHLRHLAGAVHINELTDAQLLDRFVKQRDAEDAFQAAFLVRARHAGSVRHTAALGSWLYRVAHRIATKAGIDMAKRRAQEKEADRQSTASRHCEVAWRELQAILGEELDRLPEKYRAPFVLCCLEGKSGPEAARQLGWKEGTVTGRLSQARKQLQYRLARRGIALTAVLCAAALARPASAAPTRLVRCTITRAVLSAGNRASPDLISPHVAGGMDGGSKTQFGTQTKLAALIRVLPFQQGGGKNNDGL